jgi:hypothetical protein
MRRDIVAEVVGSVRAAPRPVPLEALADRAVRALGHEKTVGSAWGGAGTFRDLLSKGLPGDVRLTDQPPYYAFDATRQVAGNLEPRPELQDRRSEYRDDPRYDARSDRLEGGRSGAVAPRQDRLLAPAPAAGGAPAPQWGLYGSPHQSALTGPPQGGGYIPHTAPGAPLPQDAAPVPRAPTSPPPSRATDSAIQQSIARIHEACQAPPLSPPEYRILFEVMAREIGTNGLAGTQTLANIGQAAREMGLEVRRDDVRFVLEVVSEADPWFEQGASPNLFASRFRNFVVARCRSQGLNLSADEIDLIDAWFGGPPPVARPAGSFPQQASSPDSERARGAPYDTRGDRWSPASDARGGPPLPDAAEAGGYGAPPAEEEFPRIVRTRLRG